MAQSLYEQLCAIAEAHPAHLIAYKDDLHKHDRHELEETQRSEHYVWLLRECGTELFPVGHGLKPVWVTYWLDNASPNVPPLAYEVNRNRGTVRPISYDMARRLAAIPHPGGRQIHVSLDRGVWETWPSDRGESKAA